MARLEMMLSSRMEMQAGSDTAEIMIFSEICPPGWKWSADDKTAADFDRSLKEAREKGARKLSIRINSPGGDVNQAMAMRGMLLYADFEEITVCIEGICASAATLIGMLPTVHVSMIEGGEYMIHNPVCGCWGQAKDMESAAQRLRNTEHELHGIYAKRCGREEAQIREWMDAETWFTAQQAQEAGFVDEIIAAEPMAACVSTEMLAAMRGSYTHLPANIRVSDGASPEASTENKGTKEETKVELNTATMENLRTENPELYRQVMQAGAAAEQARISEIDELTEPGYEEMAEKAKKDGISPMEYMKRLAKAKRDKRENEAQQGAQMMQQRRQETAAASAIPGSAAPEGKGMTEDEEISALAKEMSGYGRMMLGAGDQAGSDETGMY